MVLRKGRKGKDVMCGQVWFSILGICALHLTHPKCTHTAVSSERTHTHTHTHTQHTHTHTHTTHTTHTPEWAVNAVVPGEQLGVQCLAQRSHLSHGIEGGESAGHSLTPPTTPAGPETQTRNLRVTRSDALSIRPRLPLALFSKKL